MNERLRNTELLWKEHCENDNFKILNMQVEKHFQLKQQQTITKVHTQPENNAVPSTAYQ